MTNKTVKAIERPGGARAAGETADEAGKILRFRESERLVHWAIAIPFMTCYLTALILFVFYNPHPQRPYRLLFSWIHRGSGICFVLFPILAVLRARGDARIHFHNIKQAWIWTLDDLRWLLRMGLAAVSSKVSLPEQGKFNAAEKINFMVVMTTYPFFILTGILVWLPGIAFFSWVAHVLMAVVATPLMLGHIYMATLNPSTRVGLQGMISGFVDERWAKHHYRRWYRETFEKHRAVPAAPRKSVPALERAAKVLCPSCSTVQMFTSWATLLRGVFDREPLVCPGCQGEIRSFSAVAESSILEAILDHLEARGVDQPFEGWCRESRSFDLETGPSRVSLARPEVRDVSFATAPTTGPVRPAPRRRV